MSQVGVYFAKMLVAKQRARDADSAKVENLTKRALTDLEICFEENAESLNTYPGIEKKVILVEQETSGFIINGLLTGFVAYVTLQNGRLRLSPCLAEDEDDGGDSSDDYPKTEWYDLRWGNQGVDFVAFGNFNQGWIQYNVSVIVSRAFGIAINGTISPRFEDI